MALLHAISSHASHLKADIVAIHVDHGLQSGSASWAEWCRARCVEFGVDFILHRVSVKVDKGESVEAVARHARYQAFEVEMNPGDILLTAHHRDDQAETLFLNLLRGSGLQGLAAMPEYRVFGPGFLARPLLSVGRDELESYLTQHVIDWIDDPSNAETTFDRNFLRHEVMPLLKSRWPAVSKTFARSASHCAEASTLLNVLSEGQLDDLIGSDGSLDLVSFSQHDLSLRRLLMRQWLKSRGAPIPNTNRLERLFTEMVSASDGANPLVTWAEVEVRRYRNRLYCMAVETEPFQSEKNLNWQGRDALALPGNGSLRITQGLGGIDPEQWRKAEIEIRYRQGGELCCPAGRKGRRSLKKMMQESAVPPWLRERTPLIYLDGVLAAVAGVSICEPFAVPKDQQGLIIEWSKEIGKR